MIFDNNLLTEIANYLIPVAHAAESAAGEGQGGIAAMFGLDWKLLLAQLVNFGIILLVLWKWVFKPVAKGLTDRTAKIEQSLADAQQITEDKETFESWKTAEMGKVRQEAAGIMTAAKQEAAELKSKTLEETKQEQNRLISQAQAKLEAEKQKAVAEVKQEVASLVVSASQAILQEKIDPNKDKDLIKRALEQATR